MAMVVEGVTRPVAAPRERHRLRRVLVGFDGSPGAWAALETAIGLAVSERAPLTIAGVVRRPAWWIGAGPVAVPVTRAGLLRDVERQMEQELAAARDEVPADVSLTTLLLHGHPGRTLAALADSGGYDLVVAGPRPTGRLRSLFGGSVTHRLLERSNASLLAVKPD
jgi:nucleotide-binding universal stress UspA family protein